MEKTNLYITIRKEYDGYAELALDIEKLVKERFEIMDVKEHQEDC